MTETAVIKSKGRKWITRIAILLSPIVMFMFLNLIFPLPEPESDRDFAVAVLAEDGSPMRSFPDNQGVWRYPVSLADVSPRYIEALLQYEDRHFYQHPGINPASLLRALKDWIKYGRPVSGGSTLTMQTARIIDPHSRTIAGKIKQMFRALQLELNFSKDEILTLYMNYAPFGGSIEGVQAASYAYLGKSVRELSHAEAALLAVLPQAPSRLRPDRHPRRAVWARNKVIRRMVKFGIWDRETGLEAEKERIAARFRPRSMTAPLLARRLRHKARPMIPVKTLIDLYTQEMVEELVRNHVAGLPPRTSAAVLVLENRNLAVRAYIASADFMDGSRFGHVDMIQANRSPGSTLKPFLYAVALEEGLIHSESLLMDAPFTFKGYRPSNFSEGFSGPVSAREALTRSLNIPAVDVLDRLGPVFFDTRLRQGGLRLGYRSSGGPTLAMILGGAGVKLEELVGAYAAFGRAGLAGRPRFVKEEPVREWRFLKPGSAYIIRTILTEHTRPDLPQGRVTLDRSRRVAWKTGTSYGFRDAWAIGVTDDFTVGVWVGRPDGTPLPGHYGRATAAPLLFNVIDSLHRGRAQPMPVPAGVSRETICWPLGGRPNGDNDPLCHQTRTAWILDGIIPPTLPDRCDENWLSNPITVPINPETGLRVDADCGQRNTVFKKIAQWPKAAGPWLNPRLKKASEIPPLDPLCGKPVSDSPDSIRIMDIENQMVFRPQGAKIEMPTITLKALGGRGRLYWLLDGELIGQADIDQIRYYRFKRPGSYRLTVMDLSGNYDTVEISVLGGNPEG